MIKHAESIHKLKQTSGSKLNFSINEDKFSHILYRFVPSFIFNSSNALLKLFANGFAVLIAKLVQNNSYAENYFDLNK
jgi:hypothetical protein